MSTKYTVAGVGALGAMAAATLAAGSPHQAGVAMMATDRLGAADYEFMRYISEQGKSYGTVAEFMFRGDIFKQKHALIAEHNADANQTHTLGHNQFSDRTAEEMKRMLGYRHQAAKNVQILDESDLAASVDWRTKGAVTPVKNQGQCGSCWAFSTTGAVEGAMFLKTGTLNSFSEQQLVDCSTQNNGCNGGLMDYGFMYIESNGIELESEYPYTARDGSCHYSQAETVGQVRSYNDVSPSASQLKAAINKAPVSVAIEADQYAFQGYTGGVITSGCGSQLDHGVLAVGYGTENGVEYVLVKNSWGPSWGVGGYVKMAFNQCGVTQSASYPTE